MKQINELCIIDDDRITILLVKKRLEIVNFCNIITSFNNGKEAYDNFTDRISKNISLPDLILMDINMPIWSGWDFLDEMMKINHNQEISLFVMSSSINPADKLKASNYPIVTDFLIKPINEHILEKALEIL